MHTHTRTYTYSESTCASMSASVLCQGGGDCRRLGQPHRGAPLAEGPGLVPYNIAVKHKSAVSGVRKSGFTRSLWVVDRGADRKKLTRKRALKALNFDNVSCFRLRTWLRSRLSQRRIGVARNVGSEHRDPKFGPSSG